MPESVPQVSGAVVLDQMRVFEEVVGAEVMQAARATLSMEQRRMLTDVLPIGWVDADLVEQLYTAIAQQAHRPVAELHREVVHKGLERTFKTVWRALLRLTSDDALVARTPLLYSRGFNRGQLSTRIDVPGRSDSVLTGWPNMPQMHLNGLGYGIECVLTLAGRKQVKVTHERTRDGARLTATWKP